MTYFRKEWNDTGLPLAYLISFRTYGTWLHGDSRGSIDKNNNVFGDPFYPPDSEWQKLRKISLKQNPVWLSLEQRRLVEEAIVETCEKRSWDLLAKNARTNHVHAVADIGRKAPEKALNAFKANATRVLREAGHWQSDLSPWSAKGSKRWLWTEDDVWAAIEYVNNQ